MAYEMALWVERLAVEPDEFDPWDSWKEQTLPELTSTWTLLGVQVHRLSLPLLLLVQDRDMLSLPHTAGFVDRNCSFLRDEQFQNVAGGLWEQASI